MISEDNIKNYLELTGQVDNEGRKISTNSETERPLSHRLAKYDVSPALNWLVIILRDDGIIFISIDDNEVANLRKVCDDIFGGRKFSVYFSLEKKDGVEWWLKTW